MKKHFYWLDWIRFLAAFVVVFAHAKQNIFGDYVQLAAISKTTATAFFYFFFRLGNESVIVFFVLSGFLVGGLSIERILQGTFDLASYSIDRGVRIYMPLIPALVLSGIIALCTGKSLNGWEFVGNLLQLQGVLVDNFASNGPLWSLAYECWYYLAIPCFFLFFTRKQQWHIWLASIVVFFAIFTKLEVVYLFCWFIGALFYFNRPKNHCLLDLSLAAVLILLGLAFSQLNTASRSIQVSQYADIIPGGAVSQLIFATGCAFFIRAAAISKPHRIFIQKIESYGTFLASFSYTLYLIHYPILRILAPYFKLNDGIIDYYAIVKLGIAVMICLISAYLFYLLFERNTTIVKQWVKRFC
jgi:peptidoglycan/LPS O-acetylase OafA/YrhL